MKLPGEVGKKSTFLGTGGKKEAAEDRKEERAGR